MKIVAVLGDYYHDEAHYKKAISHTVETMDGIEILYIKRKNLINKLKDKPDLVILASENRINPHEEDTRTWLTAAGETEIVNYVKNGGSWFVWHSGLASYESNATYINMVGGYFTHHPEEHVNVLYKYKGNHKLSISKDHFKISDEHYFIEHAKDNSVFLSSTSKFGESVAGWTRKFGTGKVCCYVPAHKIEGLMDESVQTDLKHIIDWLAKSK